MRLVKLGFERLYASGVAAFALLIGAATTLQYALVGAPHQGWLYPSLVRAAAPAANGSALLLALVLWGQTKTTAVLRARLGTTLTRACLVALPGYAMAAGFAGLAAFALQSSLLGQSHGVLAAFSGVQWRDVAIGGSGALLDAGLVVLLARRFGVRFCEAPLSLPAKLVLVVTVTVPLRATLGLLFSSWVSS